MSAAVGFILLGTQKRVQNSCGKQAISVRATEGLPYYVIGENSIQVNHFKASPVGAQEI